MKCIGIEPPYTRGVWEAGYSYYANLFAALAHADDKAWLVAHSLSSDPQWEQVFAGATAGHLRWNWVDENRAPPHFSKGWWLRQGKKLFRTLPPSPTQESRSCALEKILCESEIDVLFAQNPDYDFKSVALAGWIPDLQQLSLPHLFSEEEIRGRHLLLERVVERSTVVVVSSEASSRDLHQAFPQSKEKSRTLPFLAFVPESTWQADPLASRRHYHLPERFFYLPNQWWQHKNHTLVLKALQILKSRHGDRAPVVVASGNPYDYRNPRFGAELLQTVSEWDLREHFVSLGLISYEDVRQLIRASIAVINPSRFEGWSSTVEESKSLGAALILSNIPVHHEQCGASASYVDLEDSEALADILWSYQTGESRKMPTQEEQARAQFPERWHAFSQTFRTLLSEAVDIKKGT